MKAWEERRKWIIDWLTMRANLISTTKFPVDVLNSEFVDEYIEYTEAKYGEVWFFA